MKRGYIIYPMIISSFVLAPDIAYDGKLRDKFDRFNERITRTEELTEEDNERAKDIAGKILGEAYGIPGARKIIEVIDKKLKKDGFYEQQRINKIEGPKRVKRLFRRKRK